MAVSTMVASTATADTGGTEPGVRHAHPPVPPRRVRLLQTVPRVGQPGREGVLFVRRGNAALLRAHAWMGMREVAGSAQGGAEMAALAYVG